MSNVTRLALLAALLVTACRAGSQQPTPESISTDYAHKADILVIRADTYGGLAVPVTGTHVPEISIYGDGLVVLGQEDGIRRVGTDRAVSTGRVGDEGLQRLLEFMVEAGLFQLDDRYQPSHAPADAPCREVSVRLLARSKTVSICPFDEAQAPAPFNEIYTKLAAVSPSGETVFAPESGLLAAMDLGSIEDLGGGRGSQVAPWDTPLVGFALEEAADDGGIHLQGEEYHRVEEFLLRYPPKQLFGSQEGRAYEVVLKADLPRETGSSR
jgi:hypothetical protein